MPHQDCDVALALKNVLEAKASTLKNQKQWAEQAGLAVTTLSGAMNNPNNNTTVNTLALLAKAAGMSMPEMLDYGMPDWEDRVRAREAVKGLSPEKAEAFKVLIGSP